MSQFDLTQLSKKNQEFVRIAKHQLIENGKTEEEATGSVSPIASSEPTFLFRSVLAPHAEKTKSIKQRKVYFRFMSIILSP